MGWRSIASRRRRWNAVSIGFATTSLERHDSSLILQFLPDFALWPGLKLGVDVVFDGCEPKFVEVPCSDSNLGEHDRIRNQAVQDNFIRVEIPVLSGATSFKIVAKYPGVVIDRIGIRK